MNQPNKKSSKTRIPSRQKNVLEEAVHKEPTSTNVNALKQYLDEVGYEKIKSKIRDEKICQSINHTFSKPPRSSVRGMHGLSDMAATVLAYAHRLQPDNSVLALAHIGAHAGANVLALLREEGQRQKQWAGSPVPDSFFHSISYRYDR
jgi:hypothetical protein